MAQLPELALYEELAALHQQMLIAAESLDWDRVVELESHSVTLVEALKNLASDISAHPKQKRELIQNILAAQEKIREEITVWRSDVAPLLQVIGTKIP